MQKRTNLTLLTALIVALLLLPCTYCTSYAASEPLDSDTAMQFSVQKQTSNSMTLHWQMAPGVYLYKDRIQITASPADQILVGRVVLPPGLDKIDKALGRYQIYTESLDLEVPIDIQPYATVEDLTVQVRYQGCSDTGYCYPPIVKEIAWPEADKIATIKTITADVATAPSESNVVQSLLEKQQVFFILITFLGFGVLLAFTPCVLPMLPILSGLILGRKQHHSHSKTFLLALTYVLGMAITYAGLGVVASLIGSQIQSTLQKPFILIIFSGLFVALALSLFGFYEIRLPARVQNYLNQLSTKQSAGKFFSVMIMGVLSALLVSPCITPPLVGALTYMGNTGDIYLGGSALFALGLGMGIPLILFVMLGSKLLPKSGPWMLHVEQFFGIMLLGVAITLLARILPGPVALLLWAGLLFLSALLLGTFRSVAKTRLNYVAKALGIVAFSYGIILTTAATLGLQDPLRPFQQFAKVKIYPFQRIKSVTDLQTALGQAFQQGKPVILDFYADWCTACKDMDQQVFSQPNIHKVLTNCFVAIQADITRVDQEDTNLLNHLNVIAPPTLVFFDSKGNELTQQRIVGEISRADFLKQIESIAKNPC